MNDLSHLDPKVHPVLAWPESKRIEFTRDDHWIGYARAQSALRVLSDVIEQPQTTRVRNLLLVGRGGNGKTKIIERFQKIHCFNLTPGNEPVLPVVVMNMPSEPSESRFWSDLLVALKITHRDSESVQRKKTNAQSVLQYVACRMLVIDEIQNALIGHGRQHRHFLVVMKNLSNALCLPIVAVGTRDAIRTLHTDTQLSSRFEPFGLPRWKLDEDFRNLLGSLERILPLAKPSHLTSREMAIQLHSMSGMTIGGLTRLLKLAAVEAIRSKQECIDLKLLKRIGWISMEDYGRQADEL